ncbi:MAG: hypothetical protein D6695_08410 [Planctomycetota bacterium]|nr:MAG: hypothetical protein D6695_08410 [Planctomycetota bacterium]
MREMLGVLAVVGLVLCSCESQPPVGDRAGRVEVSDTTPPEAADARPLVADFIAYSDQIAEALMRDMLNTPELAPLHSDRTTVLYGDIKNETGIVSTNDFEVVRERTKNRLKQSRMFNDRFRFLTSRQRLEELQQTELGDDLFETDARGRVLNPRIHPEDTLLLNGTMYRISRGPTSYYLMTFELVRFSDGEIVWTNDYETKRW